MDILKGSFQWRDKGATYRSDQRSFNSRFALACSKGKTEIRFNTELGSIDWRRTFNLPCFDTSKNIQAANPEFIHQIVVYGTATLVKLVEFTLRFIISRKN